MAIKNLPNYNFNQSKNICSWVFMNIDFKSELLQNKIPPANMNKVNIWKMWISSYLLGKIPWRRKYPFQYSHMGNRTDRGPDRLQSRGSHSQT